MSQEIIVMRRVFGENNEKDPENCKQLVAGDYVKYRNGHGKDIEALVVAIPNELISDPKKYVPIVQNLQDVVEDDGETYKVKLFPIAEINSAHFRHKIPR
jgi:hypothetical protein